MNVKPGMLAYVRCLNETADNGKIVEVLRPAYEGEIFADGSRRLVNQTGDPMWWVRGVDLHSWSPTLPRVSINGLREAAFYDCTLIPITPPSGSVTTEEVKELFSPSPAKESEKV